MIYGGGQQQEIDDGESINKGQAFFRCFPYMFTIDGVNFCLTIKSKIYASRPQEIDLAVILLKRLNAVRGAFNIIRENIIYKDYKDYPLVMLTLGKKKIDVSRFNDIIDIEIEKYFNYLDSILHKHKQLSLSKDEVIEFLHNEAFGAKLAKQIHKELQILRDDDITLLNDFNETREFLNKFHIDIYSNSIQKE